MFAAVIFPAYIRHWSHVVLILAHRLWRCSSIKTTLGRYSLSCWWSFTFIHVFCETQWRHSVKIKLYNTPSPILHSVKRHDVTRWKHGYIRTLPILYCISQLGENKGGRGHWVSQNCLTCLTDLISTLLLLSCHIASSFQIVLVKIDCFVYQIISNEENLLFLSLWFSEYMSKRSMYRLFCGIFLCKKCLSLNCSTRNIRPVFYL